MINVKDLKKKWLLAIALSVLLLVCIFLLFKDKADAPAPSPKQTQINNPKDPAPEHPIQEQPVSFDKKMHSTTEPTSIWLVVNKDRPIPASYVPELIVPDVKLRLSATQEQMKFAKVATSALEEMFSRAKNDGVTLVFGSGYRSYALQKQFYDGYVARDGKAAADRYSARPGTSEHQTGLSFDATSISQKCHLEVCFEDLPEGKWLAANAYKYGFTLRYRKGKESITTYQYEPWHFRYVGRDLAVELQRTNQTLEEFFNLN